jgi:hypothetical protein
MQFFLIHTGLHFSLIWVHRARDRGAGHPNLGHYCRDTEGSLKTFVGRTLVRMVAVEMVSVSDVRALRIGQNYLTITAHTTTMPTAR